MAGAATTFAWGPWGPADIGPLSRSSKTSDSSTRSARDESTSASADRAGVTSLRSSGRGHRGEPEESDRPPPRRSPKTENGLLIPRYRPHSGGIGQVPPHQPDNGPAPAEGAPSQPTTASFIEDILGLLDGSYRSSDGLDPHPVPGVGAQVEPWILGSSAGRERRGRRQIRSEVRRQLPHQPGHRSRGGPEA